MLTAESMFRVVDKWTKYFLIFVAGWVIGSMVIPFMRILTEL
jgi:hypothetical protein